MVGRLRSRYPELESWICAHRALTIEAAPAIEGLMEVVDYLRTHPRPNVFARELPVAVDTKFVGRHRRILRKWLDLVLPPETIRADEEHFERRFGLRYAAIRVRGRDGLVHNVVTLTTAARLVRGAPDSGAAGFRPNGVEGRFMTHLGAADASSREP